MRYEDYQNRGASPHAGSWPLTTVFTVYQHEALRMRSAYLSVAVWHLVNRVGLLITRLRDRAAHARDYRRAASDLGRLTDHELKDIGITRSQIESVVRYGRMQQPRPEICRQPQIGRVVEGGAVNRSGANLAA